MDDPKTVEVPELIAGRYRLRRQLGRGGFGRVYLARDESCERPLDVAIKVLPLRSARDASQFRHEARALGTLCHPNIVKVLDVWDDEQTGALVMEYVRGKPLSHRVGGSVMPASAAIDHVLAVCEALEHAHLRNVVHRDVSPNNILVTASGTGIKLIDFGLSVSEFSGERVPGGTRSFAAPEQLRGGSERDPRSDVYGVGAVLLTLLTGKIPRADGVAVEDGSELPPFVVALVSRAMEADPERRYASIRDLSVALVRARAALATDVGAEAPEAAAETVTVAAPEDVAPVGREAELSTLLGCLESARVGRGRVVSVTGSSGSGKSRLLSQLVAEAVAGGALVLRGGSIENGRSVAYGAFREALADLDASCRRRDDAALRARKRLGRAASGRESEVLRLAPWLEDLLDDGVVGDRRRAEGGALQQQFLGELRQFLTELGGPGSPLVLWLDDVQWADASTLRAVEWLARTIGERHCLLLLSYRDDEPSQVERVLSSSRARVSVPLGPLTARQIGELLPRIVGAPVEPLETAAGLVAGASRGNPFSVWEVCRGLVCSGALRPGGSRPGALELDIGLAERILARFTPTDILTERLRRLDPAVRDGLARASVWGRRFTREQAELGDDAVRVSVELGLVALDREHVIVFTHDRVHEAASGLLGPDEARRLHHLAGEALCGSEGTRALAVEHFVASADLGLAGRVALEAAEDAIRISAFDAARALHRRVLDWAREGKLTLSVPEHARLLRRSAELALSVGEYEEACVEFEQWLALDTGTEISPGGALGRARACGGLAEARFHLGDLPASIELNESALAELGLTLPRGGGALLVYMTRQVLVAAGHAAVAGTRFEGASRADALIDEAIARLTALSHSVYYVATFRSLAASLTATNLADRQRASRSKAQVFALHAASCLAVPVFVARFRRYGDQGIAVAEELGDDWAVLFARSFAAIVAFCTADWPRVHAEAARVDELARRVRDPALSGLTLKHVAFTEYCVGNLGRSIDIALQLRSHFETYASRTGALDACFFLPQALLGMGRVEDAARIADFFREEAVALDNRQGVIQALVHQALVALSRDDWRTACESSARACELARAQTLHNVHLAEKGAVHLLSLAAARRLAPPEERPGIRAFARGVVEGAIGVAQGPARRAFNLWALGRATTAFGFHRTGRWLLDRAARSAERHGTRLDGARALADLALAELSEDPTSRSGVESVDRALLELDACGATGDRFALLKGWARVRGTVGAVDEGSGPDVTGTQTVTARI